MENSRSQSFSMGGGRQLKYFLEFSLPNLGGNEFQIDKYIFQMGGKKPPTKVFSGVNFFKLDRKVSDGFFLVGFLRCIIFLNLTTCI